MEVRALGADGKQETLLRTVDEPAQCAADGAGQVAGDVAKLIHELQSAGVQLVRGLPVVSAPTPVLCSIVYLHLVLFITATVVSNCTN